MQRKIQNENGAEVNVTKMFLVLIIIAHNENMQLTASSIDYLGFACLNHVCLCGASVLHLLSLFEPHKTCFPMSFMFFYATWPLMNLCICLSSFHVSLDKCSSSTWFQYNSMYNDMILIYSIAIQVINIYIYIFF